MPTLRHPNLPADQTITVADESVPHYVRSGWQDAETAPTEKPAEPVNQKEN